MSSIVYPPISGTSTSSLTLGGDSQAGLRRFRAAKARALLNIGLCHIAFYGDSISQGFFGSTPYYLQSHPSIFRTSLGALGTGVQVLYSPSQGDKAETDVRLTYIGIWNNIGDGFMNAGSQYANGITNKLTFTTTCDQFAVYYLSGAAYGGGIFSLSVDGGTAQTVNSSTFSGTAKATITAGTLGSHTLTITAPAIGNVVINAVEGTVGTTGFRVSRTAVGSAKSVDLISRMDLVFDLVVPDLSIFAFGLNDWGGQVDLTTFKSNMQTAHDRAKLTGDVLWVVEIPPDESGGGKTISWAQYADIIRSLASTNAESIIDFTARWGTHAISQAAPISMKYDGLHPNATGQRALAQDFISTLI